MDEKMFKAYLDMIVEKAFIKGAVWESYKVVSEKEAIEEAKKEILDLEF